MKGKKGKKVEEMEDSLVHVDELMTQLLHCSIVNDEHTSTSVGCSSSSSGGGSSSGSRKTGEMSELDEVEKAIEAQQKWNKHVASNRKLEGLEEEVPIFLEWSKYVRRCCFFFFVISISCFPLTFFHCSSFYSTSPRHLPPPPSF